MKRYVFDLETNGLVHELDRVHSLVIRDADTNEVYSCADQPGYDSVHTGLTLLSQADMLIGHNIINFDFRALFKLFPNLTKKKDCIIYDTFIVCLFLWPELEQIDENVYICCAVTKEPDDVLDLIDKLKKFLNEKITQ